MLNRGLVRALSVMTLGATLIHHPPRANAMASAEAVQGTPFTRHVVQDVIGRNVTYYISRPKTASAPLLLMIQGSGCAKLLHQHAGGAFSTLFNLAPFAAEGRFTVVAVEKPFAGQSAASNAGMATACSPEFNQDFTAERWLLALQASLNDARKSPWVDQHRTMVLGTSEGAVMATMVASKDDRITDVVVIGGSGTTQLYDFFAQAYRTCFDISGCLAKVENTARAIAAEPDSSTRFAWGHPHKRWSSFFRIDPSEQLLKSKARVYLAFGTNDDAVPALSQEITVAKLLAAGRTVTVRRIADGDHSLRQPGTTNLDDLNTVQRAALNWFWNP